MDTLMQTLSAPWSPPQSTADIPHGDMPGDSIHIGDTHREKANVIFPALQALLPDIVHNNPHQRAVIAVCGGSGVGKSETASLLSHYFRSLGIGSYTLSGDNYPHRIPKYNDAERLRIFRYGGMRGLVESGVYTLAIGEQVRAFQRDGLDGDAALEAQYPWMATYNRAGAAALQAYLGSPQEIHFSELNHIISQFKNGADTLVLKRMGREETALWYERIDCSQTRILVIEWTHANSGHLHGVDVPILLNSTPAETLAYRKTRHRDGGVDSPFTTTVLALEQKMLEAQAYKAKIIVSKEGDLLSYSAYRRLMAEA